MRPSPSRRLVENNFNVIGSKQINPVLAAGELFGAELYFPPWLRKASFLPSRSEAEPKVGMSTLKRVCYVLRGTHL